jgi:uncharacterized membrane protein YgcG
MQAGRWLRHLWTGLLGSRRHFTPAVLAQIESEVRAVEARHAGEIRFAIEAAFDGPALWRGRTPRERAVHLFAELGVWDTAANNGVLIYVLLADRDVEIVADRGIASRVPQAEWDAVCREMEDEFRAGRHAQGSLVGVRGVGTLLARHFPLARADRNEQPDQPILL